MVFKKKRMIERIAMEGRSHLIDTESIKIMDDLDGCKVDIVNWRRTVFGEPVFWCVGKSGEGHYVNEKDCE